MWKTHNPGPEPHNRLQKIFVCFLLLFCCFLGSVFLLRHCECLTGLCSRSLYQLRLGSMMRREAFFNTTQVLQLIRFMH